jgi:rare lipoprotein A
MRSVSYRVLGLGLGVAFTLTACLDATSSRSDPATAPDAGRVVERDIEDPATFSRNETGLWDGRPSLGGVWVAHPDARSPERVIIRNSETGRQTVGVLFRRERLNPGPAFQISAEAATAIGVLAGAPTQLQVVALRSEELAPISAQPAPAQQAQTAAQPATLAPEAPSDATAPAGETLIALPAETAAPRGGLLSRIFRREPAPDMAHAAPDIQQTALPDAPAAAPAPAAAVAPVASGLERPYIQLGIFSVESNAANAQRMATGAGLAARVVEGRTQANAFWRVVVGPAQTAADHSRMLAQVKALGFTDAYAVRR